MCCQRFLNGSLMPRKAQHWPETARSWPCRRGRTAPQPVAHAGAAPSCQEAQQLDTAQRDVPGAPRAPRDLATLGMTGERGTSAGLVAKRLECKSLLSRLSAMGPQAKCPRLSAPPLSSSIKQQCDFPQGYWEG